MGDKIINYIKKKTYSKFRKDWDKEIRLAIKRNPILMNRLEDD